MKIVFASTNSGKIQELNSLFMPSQINIIPQSLMKVPEIEETAQTFVENALIKARNASKITNLPAIADDSGLLVDALNGAPGIYSARYSGKKATAIDNINKLLSELKHHPDENRTARFYCVLVFIIEANDPTPLICEGTWEGLILKKPQGTDGFGYDPVFFDPHQNQSAAECPLSKKNQISHRGKALMQLKQRLPEKYHASTFHTKS